MPEAKIQSCQMNKQDLQQNQFNLNPKLKERLGYSNIYSKRNSQQLLNYLSGLEQKKLLEKLKVIYSQILLNYFSSQDNINNLIDRFVEEAFFVNLPMNKIVEIHMELIDNLEY